jgi:hypothetical protein
LILPTGTIPPNPDQRELDFEHAVSIQRATLRNVITTTYNEIVVRGENRTSTTTLAFGDDWHQLERAWTDAQETSYLSGASLDNGYSALSRREKYRNNAIARSADTFATVFCRFQLSEEWTQRAATLFQGEDTREWHVAVPIDDNGDPQPLYDAGSNPTGNLIWPKTLRFMQQLALRQALDYSDDRIATGDFEEFSSIEIESLDTVQHLKPLFFWQDATNNHFVMLDKLAGEAAFESVVRDWSIEAEFASRGPVVDLRVIGAPQHLIAEPRWDGTEALTDPHHVPANQGGLDYEAFYATVTIDTGVPFEYAIQIGASQSGIMRRTLYIDAPDARLDYVVPYTVVAISSSGVKQTTTGGFVRDDRDRLKLIAESAAAWYGTLRQTLEVSFRKISPVVELGSLIVAIPSNYQREDVNTVVTRLSYNFSDPRNAFTEFETSFAEFELI